MARIAILLSILLVLGGEGICEEPSNTESKKSPNLVTGVWRVPPGFMFSADPAEKNEFQKPLSGFNSKQNPRAFQYDASEYLKASGVEFPPGSEALYDQASGSLVVRNTQENLELIELLADCPMGSLPANVAIEISTFECRLPSKYSGPASNWPKFSDLTKSGTELKLLDRVSSMTKSGIRATMNHVIVPVPAQASSPDVREKTESAGFFQSGESGTLADSETVVGPDGVTIDSNMRYRFRRPAGKGASEISFKTSFTTWEGFPIVLHVSPVPNDDGKFVVVVANVHLVHFGGWNLKETASGPDASPAGSSGR